MNSQSGSHTPRTPRAGGSLAAHLSQVSRTKMVAATNAKPTAQQLNTLLSENASLKTRLNSTLDDLREARDIYEKQHAKWRSQYERLKEELARRAANASQYEALQRQHQHFIATGGVISSPYRGGGGGLIGRIADHHSTSPSRSAARLATSNLYLLNKEKHFNNNVEGVEDEEEGGPLKWVISMPPWLNSADDGPFGKDVLIPADGGDGKIGIPHDTNRGGLAKKFSDAVAQTSRTGSPAPRSSQEGGMNHPDVDNTTDESSDKDGRRKRVSQAAELRLLNAELLSLQAQNAVLKGSVEMLRRDVASDATGRIVHRYEEAAVHQIRDLGRALEASNKALNTREQDLLALEEERNNLLQLVRNDDYDDSNGSRAASVRMGLGGRARSPSATTTNSIKPQHIQKSNQFNHQRSSSSGVGGDRTLRGREGGGLLTANRYINAYAMMNGGVSGGLLKGRSSSVVSSQHQRGAPSRSAVPSCSVGVGTDGPWVEGPPPPMTSSLVVRDAADDDAHRHGSTYALISLQHALEVTKAQLRQALEELAVSKESFSPSSNGTAVAMYGGNDGPGIPRQLTHRVRTMNVGTQVNEHSAMERLFKVFHEDFTTENVERILADRQDKSQGAMLALTEVSKYALNDSHTKVTLQNTRTELLAAHEHIEELEFALELERREKERALDYATAGLRDGHTSSRGEGRSGDVVGVLAPGEAARQASHEIAFLCDTLSATKMENDMLHDKLHACERERANAVASLAALKKRSNQIVRGCQQVAEESRSDAEAMVLSLSAQVHQRQSEIGQLRGLLGQARRGHDELKQRLENTEQDLAKARTQVTTVRDSSAKLREEYNAVTVQLRQTKEKFANAVGHSSPLLTGSFASASFAAAVGGGGGTTSSPFRQTMINQTGNAAITATGRDLNTSPLRATYARGHSPPPTIATAASPNQASSPPNEGGVTQRNSRPSHFLGVGSSYANSDGLDSPRDSNCSLTPKHANDHLPRGAGVTVTALELLANSDPAERNGHHHVQTKDSPRSARNHFNKTSSPHRGAVALVPALDENDSRMLLESLLPYAPGATTPSQIVEGVLSSAELLNDRISELESELKTKTLHLTAAKKDVALLQQRVRKLEIEKESPSLSAKVTTKLTVKDRREQFTANQTQQMLKDELRTVAQALEETRARLVESEREIEEGKELMLRLIQEKDEELGY